MFFFFFFSGVLSFSGGFRGFFLILSIRVSLLVAFESGLDNRDCNHFVASVPYIRISLMNLISSYFLYRVNLFFILLFF